MLGDDFVARPGCTGRDHGNSLTHQLKVSTCAS
jgi:hypothetical protein